MNVYASNGLEDENADRKEKQWDKKRSKQKKKLSTKQKWFHYVINYANVRFFFSISLKTCSHLLNDVNS